MLNLPCSHALFKALPSKHGVFWGEVRGWKEVFVREESSSQAVWEGGAQGSGHTERGRLGSKEAPPPDDLKN